MLDSARPSGALVVVWPLSGNANANNNEGHMRAVINVMHWASAVAGINKAATKHTNRHLLPFV